MKLEKIIQEAANMLGIEAPKKSANYRFLFRCANLVLSNIACNYRDFVTEEIFDVKNGRIDFSQFTETVLKIKDVSAPYELFLNEIVVPNGMVAVKYAYIPVFKKATDRVFNEAIMLYGIMAEYADISGMGEDAKIYARRFEQLLFSQHCTGKTRRMP